VVAHRYRRLEGDPEIPDHLVDVHDERIADVVQVIEVRAPRVAEQAEPEEQHHQPEQQGADDPPRAHAHRVNVPRGEPRDRDRGDDERRSRGDRGGKQE
jgi:hypothetical protein